MLTPLKTSITAENTPEMICPDLSTPILKLSLFSYRSANLATRAARTAVTPANFNALANSVASGVVAAILPIISWSVSLAAASPAVSDGPTFHARNATPTAPAKIKIPFNFSLSSSTWDWMLSKMASSQSESTSRLSKPTLPPAAVPEPLLSCRTFSSSIPMS